MECCELGGQAERAEVCSKLATRRRPWRCLGQRRAGREQGELGIGLGFAWERESVGESERRAPGGLIIGKAELYPTWHSLTGRGARRERPTGIRQEKEAVLRERVCERGTWSLARF
jgi:hypothetical protein